MLDHVHTELTKANNNKDKVEQMNTIYKNVQKLTTDDESYLNDGYCFIKTEKILDSARSIHKFSMTIYPARNQEWAQFKDVELITIREQPHEFIVIGTVSEKAYFDKFTKCVGDKVEAEKVIKPLSKWATFEDKVKKKMVDAATAIKTKIKDKINEVKEIVSET